MSSRKRPLAEISQAQSTPSRYAPSTPHAIRALQQRSGAKTRSARSVRHVNTAVVHPDSIRGVLRQFAKISAPVTKKRIVTPGSIFVDKENQRPDDAQEDENDSILLKKPNLTFTIDESIEDEDSELPVAPTPSVLPDDEDDEQSTITFQNVTSIPLRRPASERSDRRISMLSRLHSEPLRADNDDDEHDGDLTIMTERGRRAVSEEATGRLSRYSFGGFRMSDFGSELEVQRLSDVHGKATHTDLDDYLILGGNSINGDDTEDLRIMHRSPSIEVENDTIQLSTIEDETFRLDVPQDDDEAVMQATQTHIPFEDNVTVAASPRHRTEDAIIEVGDNEHEVASRRQTLLETATTKSHTSRRKALKLTRHGTTVPSLPTSLIKRVVLDSYEKQFKRKPALGSDHIKALEQATEWFFEQAGEDLAAYSSHGRRKKRVNADDVLLLMKRQKVVAEDGELRDLAKSWLPKDILRSLDLPDSV